MPPHAHGVACCRCLPRLLLAGRVARLLTNSLLHAVANCLYSVLSRGGETARATLNAAHAFALIISVRVLYTGEGIRSVIHWFIHASPNLRPMFRVCAQKGRPLRDRGNTEKRQPFATKKPFDQFLYWVHADSAPFAQQDINLTVRNRLSDIFSSHHPIQAKHRMKQSNNDLGIGQSLRPSNLLPATLLLGT